MWHWLGTRNKSWCVSCFSTSTPDIWASWGKKELAKGPVVSDLIGFLFLFPQKVRLRTGGFYGLGFEGDLGLLLTHHVTLGRDRNIYLRWLFWGSVLRYIKSWFFFFWLCPWHSQVSRPGSNPCHSSHLSICSDSAWSLTCRTTRKIHRATFLLRSVCVLSGSSGCFLPTWWLCSGMPTWPLWGSEDVLERVSDTQKKWAGDAHLLGVREQARSCI